MFKRLKLRWFVVMTILVMGLNGCTLLPDSTEPVPAPDDESVIDDRPAYEQTTERSNDIAYNLERLADRDYIDTYGDGENEKIWYQAAENLGQIGKPAVPYLIDRLSSDDEYEVMLALYALQLATQDRQLQEPLDGNYVRFPSVLNPRANAHNVAIARDWWREYKHVWDVR